MKLAFLLVTFGLAASQAPAFQASGGSIEGQVVDSRTGAPVRNSNVQLNPGMTGPQRPGEPLRQYAGRFADTDDQGRFVFQNLPSGNYHLMVQRHGGSVGGFGGPGEIFLGDRQQLKGLVVKLASQSVIVGKVLDRGGEPVERANVAILRAFPGANGMQWMPSNSAQTNDLGEFRIAGVLAGRYRLSATYRDQRATAYPGQPFPVQPEMSYVTTYFGDTADFEKAQYLTVEAGAEAHADFHLQMAASFHVRGRLADPSESAPNQYPSVNLAPKHASPGEMFGQSFSRYSPMDSSFDFAGVVPGEYYLVARKNAPFTGAPSPPAWGTVQAITVGSQSLEGIVLTLAPSRDVQGSVQVEGNGTPNLANLTIQTNSPDGMNNGQPPGARGISGAQFILRNVSPGRTTVYVNNPPNGWYVKSIQYDGKEIPETGADLTTGGSVVVVLSNKGAQLAGRILDAAGKPLPRASLALVGAKGSRMEQSTSDANGEFRVFRTLAPGDYLLYAWENAPGNAVAPQEMLSRLEGKGKAVKLAAGDNVLTDVTAISQSELAGSSGAAAQHIEFPRTKGSVAGQVLDARTGSAVKNALVRLSPSSPGAVNYPYNPNVPPRGESGPSVHTDDHGSFAFDNVDPGWYQLDADQAGYLPGIYGQRRDRTTDGLVVGEGQDVGKLAIRLTHQAVAAGRVTDQYGDPVINAAITLHRQDAAADSRANNSPDKRGSTNANGEFRLSGLAAGTYLLAVHPVPLLTPPEQAALPLPDGAEMRYPLTYYSSPIVIESGAEVSNLDVKLQKTAAYQIRGTVTGTPPRTPGGRGPVVALYSMAASASPALPEGSVYSRPDGAFTIVGVLPGSYMLTARQWVDSGNSFGGYRAIEVRDRNLDGVQLTMKAGADVKAAIVWEKPAGSRLNGTFLNLLPAYPNGAGASGQMEDETRIVFHNVIPIPVTLAPLNFPTPCYCFVKSVRYGGREIPEEGVDVTTGAAFELVLSSSAAIVEGTVVDLQGKPVGGASIAIAPKDAAPAKLRTGTADSSGRFYFDGNPPGEYLLYAWDDIDPSKLHDAGFLKQSAAGAMSVKLEPLKRQSVQLPAIPQK